MTISGKEQAAIVATGAAVLMAALAVFGFPPKKTPFDNTGEQTTAFAPEAPVLPSVVATQETLASPQTFANAIPPRFDVVRVNPDGDAVIAGRITPGLTLELLVNGRVYDRLEAGDSDAFALTPPPLPPGNHELALRAVALDGTVINGHQSVTVVIADDRRSPPVVALAEPDKPTVVLSGPGINGTEHAKTAAAQAVQQTQEAIAIETPPAALSVSTVEAEAGRLYVSGKAPPGSIVRLYLNDSYLAEGAASPAGQVAFNIGSGLRDGDYRVRLDEASPDDGKVLSRVQVPFEMNKAHLDEAAPQEAAQLAPVSRVEDAEPVIVPEVRTTRVTRGDSLWRISQRVYGQGMRYTVIYGANQGQIHNPDLIYPGQVFVLPGDPDNSVVQ